MVTFLSVVGARPNFMKIAPIHRELSKHRDRVRHVILHTGQHYDEKMSRVFFEDLELPQPDIYLGIGSGTHAEQTGRIMMEFEKALLEVRPDLVIVVGDVNSTLACSVTCAKQMVPVVHVEAGLRSFDRGMPEEINRMVTDILSDHLFITEQSGIDNLRREGIHDDKMHFVGDVMIDSLAHYRGKAGKSAILAGLGVTRHNYTLITLHRPSNVDVRENLEKVLDIFEQIHPHTSMVFPIHPRTRKRIEEFDLGRRFEALDRLVLCDPIGYLDFLCLMDNAQLILTDSGGIQEESTYLQVPCLTLRENTERPITIEEGTNQLLGLNVPLVVRKSMEVFEGRPKQGRIPDLWDGRAAERIVNILLKQYAS
jgi:UDP-N-acetylglucosamine 2-epimerase (non-hydrolysing)